MKIASAGDATDFLETLDALAAEVTAKTSTLVLAHTALSSAKDSTGWWERVESIESDIASRIAHVRPRSVVIVFDGRDNDPSGLVSFARGIVEQANVHATNSLGLQLTVVGIALATPDAAQLTADRVIEHVTGSATLGDGVVVTDAALRTRSIRQLILETLL